jgi:hypothetical protein
MFNVTSIAKRRVADKRKRKGLGELKPRKENVFKQMFKSTLACAAGNLVIAPIERCRIIL